MAKSSSTTKAPKKAIKKKTVKAAAKPAPKTASAKPVAKAKVAAEVVAPASTPKPQTIAGGGNVYTGIGGWTFEPWRGVFYPDGLPHTKELEYAAACLTSIEINGTFYRTQTPATFHKWASEVPNGFKFSVKGVRYVTNRSVLAEAGDSIKRFIDSGVLELGDRLGPLLWQMNPYKKFDEADFGKFLELLPPKVGDQQLRHVVEVRHDSFKTPAFIALLRQFNVGIVYSEHETYTEIADITSDFVYARLQKGDDNLVTGYPPAALDAWAERLKVWAQGGQPDDLPRVDGTDTPRTPRDVFAYVIHEGKVRAPSAAMELIKRLA
ncbi:DUF72 domain-containing protein [Bradyrhizobium sp. LHD-71]|uniref:DUF72 domain-containing protein n=1 Tax=Bradyrhizobium sp. LHD-71 TaxID=3072141 RepID=UPI00280E1956|nr:DUF72 domain-containing protein [Bradyrhizobium sp. LHD-71]MDQ8731752.1 DUF72 domain-containing protein [Bradyrhizobium sp. LHD-71]